MGFLIKKYRFISEQDGKVISKLLMHTTFPALMIVSIAKVNLEPKLFLIPVLCVFLGALMLLISWFSFKKQLTPMRAILTMGTGNYNVGLFGFPLIEGIWGKEALLYAIMFDIGNMIITFGAVYPIANYFSKEGKTNGLAMLKKVLLVPPVTGLIIGLIINLLNIELPTLVFDFLETLAKSNKALVLLLMGIYLSFELNKNQIKYISKALLIRYGIGCLAVMCIYYGISDFSLMKKVLIVLVVLPAGMTVLPISDEFNFDSRMAGTLVNISLLMSFIIIWGLVIGLGLI